MASAITQPTFVSGVSQQLSASAAAMLTTYVTADGNLTLAISPDNSTWTVLYPFVEVELQSVFDSIIVPAAWYVRLTLDNGARVVSTATTLS